MGCGGTRVPVLLCCQPPLDDSVALFGAGSLWETLGEDKLVSGRSYTKPTRGEEGLGFLWGASACFIQPWSAVRFAIFIILWHEKKYKMCGHPNFKAYDSGSMVSCPWQNETSGDGWVAGIRGECGHSNKVVHCPPRCQTSQKTGTGNCAAYREVHESFLYGVQGLVPALVRLEPLSRGPLGMGGRV